MKSSKLFCACVLQTVAVEAFPNTPSFFFQGPFDAVRKLLSRGESSKMDLNEKSDMFFCDYSLMPLFVQENYLAVDPGQAG